MIYNIYNIYYMIQKNFFCVLYKMINILILIVLIILLILTALHIFLLSSNYTRNENKYGGTRVQFIVSTIFKKLYPREKQIPKFGLMEPDKKRELIDQLMLNCIINNWQTDTIKLQNMRINNLPLALSLLSPANLKLLLFSKIVKEFSLEYSPEIVTYLKHNDFSTFQISNLSPRIPPTEHDINIICSLIEIIKNGQQFEKFPPLMEILNVKEYNYVYDMLVNGRSNVTIASNKLDEYNRHIDNIKQCKNILYTSYILSILEINRPFWIIANLMYSANIGLKILNIHGNIEEIVNYINKDFLDLIMSLERAYMDIQLAPEIRNVRAIINDLYVAYAKIKGNHKITRLSLENKTTNPMELCPDLVDKVMTYRPNLFEETSYDRAIKSKTVSLLPNQYELHAIIDTRYLKALQTKTPYLIGVKSPTSSGKTVGIIALIEFIKKYNAKILYVCNCKIVRNAIIELVTNPRINIDYFSSDNPKHTMSNFDNASIIIVDSKSANNICKKYIFDKRIGIEVNDEFILCFDEAMIGADGGINNNVQMDIFTQLMHNPFPYIKILMSATLPYLYNIPYLKSIFGENIDMITSEEMSSSATFHLNNVPFLPHEMANTNEEFIEIVGTVLKNPAILRAYQPKLVLDMYKTIKNIINTNKLELLNFLNFYTEFPNIGALYIPKVWNYAKRLLCWIISLESDMQNVIIQGLIQRRRIIPTETFLNNFIETLPKNQLVPALVVEISENLLTYIDKMLARYNISELGTRHSISGGPLKPLNIDRKNMSDNEIHQLLLGIGIYDNNLVSDAYAIQSITNVPLNSSNKSGITILFSNPEIGIGVNFNFGTLVIGEEFSKKSTAEGIIQLIGRVGRRGQSHIANIYFLSDAAIYEIICPNSRGKANGNFERLVIEYWGKFYHNKFIAIGNMLKPYFSERGDLYPFIIEYLFIEKNISSNSLIDIQLIANSDVLRPYILFLFTEFGLGNILKFYKVINKFVEILSNPSNVNILKYIPILAYFKDNEWPSDEIIIEYVRIADILDPSVTVNRRDKEFYKRVIRYYKFQKYIKLLCTEEDKLHETIMEYMKTEVPAKYNTISQIIAYITFSKLINKSIKIEDTMDMFIQAGQFMPKNKNFYSTIIEYIYIANELFKLELPNTYKNVLEYIKINNILDSIKTELANLRLSIKLSIYLKFANIIREYYDDNDNNSFCNAVVNCYIIQQLLYTTEKFSRKFRDEIVSFIKIYKFIQYLDPISNIVIKYFRQNINKLVRYVELSNRIESILHINIKVLNYAKIIVELYEILKYSINLATIMDKDIIFYNQIMESLISKNIKPSVFYKTIHDMLTRNHIPVENEYDRYPNSLVECVQILNCIIDKFDIDNLYNDIFDIFIFAFINKLTFTEDIDHNNDIIEYFIISNFLKEKVKLGENISYEQIVNFNMLANSMGESDRSGDFYERVFIFSKIQDIKSAFIPVLDTTVKLKDIATIEKGNKMEIVEFKCPIVPIFNINMKKIIDKFLQLSPNLELLLNIIISEYNKYKWYIETKIEQNSEKEVYEYMHATVKNEKDIKLNMLKAKWRKILNLSSKFDITKDKEKLKCLIKYDEYTKELIEKYNSIDIDAWIELRSKYGYNS